MRILIAGASGALGRQLVPLLVARGHQVVGTARTEAKAAALRALGAEPAAMDGLNRDAVIKAVVDARPEIIVNEMTALASVRSLRHFDRKFALTNRLRTEGTEFLLEAAREAGARKFIAQSYSGWPNDRSGPRAAAEEDPLDANPPKDMRQALAAIGRLEALTAAASGMVLRYGSFYGPGTSTSMDGEIALALRARKFPVIGDGGGVWSFLHIGDAAAATVLAIESGASGVYNIVDDEPAEVAVWLPELAKAIGAKPPRHVPAWLGGLLIGEAGVSMMTRVRGSSNAKARRDLEWRPHFASWREGFHHGLA